MAIQLEKVQDVIVACCILHNIAIVERDPEARPVPDQFENVHDVVINDEPDEPDQQQHNETNTIRYNLVNNYFAGLAAQEYA